MNVQQRLIRIIDILLSAVILILLAPFFIVIGLLIKFTSKGPVFYIQQRVGRFGKEFGLFKFRSMHVNADKMRSLTVGERDTRLTSIGYFLRKYKLDELPQLINVLKNEMSIVGPRPELKKFVEHYSEQQKKVLSIKPGITDYASIIFRHESKLLAAKENPEEYYINRIMPLKIRLNSFYLRKYTVSNYFYIMFATVAVIFTDWQNALKEIARQNIYGSEPHINFKEIQTAHGKNSTVNISIPESSMYASEMITLAEQYSPENNYQDNIYNFAPFFYKTNAKE